MFKKILVANRGEIALRVICACRELGIKTVAVYSEADENSLHVRFADEDVCIGPARSADSYLNVPAVLSAAEITGADAIHPGYGFLSESAYLAEVCEACHIKFIGPAPNVIRLLGDKARARRAMKKAGVPILPGSDGPVEGEEKALKIARELGFPVIIKAVAGGGGRGMRVVKAPAELAHALRTAQREAEAAFGVGDVYVEKYLESPRHIEFQVLGDHHGNVVHLGERECSIQRRHQKLIEESPSAALDATTREAMESTVEKACAAIGYRNAGTFEFLVGPDGAFYFIEVNCRLQVEHPVSELVTGIDIVREQIRIASGDPLAATGRANRSGHAIEIRINAEDPARGFLPAPGTVTRFTPPLGPGVRVDTAVSSGVEIPPYYDSMIAKVIVADDTRDAAIARAERALRELRVDGIPTTRELALDVLGSSEFRSGDYSTSTLAELEGRVPSLLPA
jgi:acetyl-CoA carboxylase biotin carboxylase subunit